MHRAVLREDRLFVATDLVGHHTHRSDAEVDGQFVIAAGGLHGFEVGLGHQDHPIEVLRGAAGEVLR